MSKSCRDCDYFNGYNYDDGTSDCSYTGGYENCPYNDETIISNNGVSVNIDVQFMSDYIKHTLINTLGSEARAIAEREIRAIITEDIKSSIKTQMRESIQKCVDEEVEEFMSKKITIGGGWREPDRELTHREFLGETVETMLDRKFSSDDMRRMLIGEAESYIQKFINRTKESINAQVKQLFTDATRQALTDSVVNMLMCNDTYKKLSDSTQKLIP